MQYPLRHEEQLQTNFSSCANRQAANANSHGKLVLVQVEVMGVTKKSLRSIASWERKRSVSTFCGDSQLSRTWSPPAEVPSKQKEDQELTPYQKKCQKERLELLISGMTFASGEQTLILPTLIGESSSEDDSPNEMPLGLPPKEITKRKKRPPFSNPFQTSFHTPKEGIPGSHSHSVRIPAAVPSAQVPRQKREFDECMPTTRRRRSSVRPVTQLPLSLGALEMHDAQSQPLNDVECLRVALPPVVAKTYPATESLAKHSTKLPAARSSSSKGPSPNKRKVGIVRSSRRAFQGTTKLPIIEKWRVSRANRPYVV